MKSRHSSALFRLLSIILILFGMLFAFFGLRALLGVVYTLSGQPILPVATLLPWESALYGAIMVGWGVTLLFVGRIAFRRKDPALLRALLYGLIAWLVIEGLFSAYWGVWFNVGVDTIVLALFSFPLTKAIRESGP